MENKVNLAEVTREYLDTLSIYEIRTFARSVGVPHPTALKKQEMIDSIIDIKDGKLQPQAARRAGRPPKTIAKSETTGVNDASETPVAKSENIRNFATPNR